MSTDTPTWVHAYTTTSGLPDPRLVGTFAKPRRCTGCRAWVLAGYDSPLIAALAICDPHPLTPALEAAAVILGRPTWRLWGHPGAYQLTQRTPTRMRLVRAPADACVVLASHQCGRPPLSRAPLTVTAARAVRSDTPPY